MEPKKRKEKTVQIPEYKDLGINLEGSGVKITLLQALNHFRITGLFRQYCEKKYLGVEMIEQEWELEFKNSGLIF